jgi:hypothetical protein
MKQGVEVRHETVAQLDVFFDNVFLILTEGPRFLTTGIKRTMVSEIRCKGANLHPAGKKVHPLHYAQSHRCLGSKKANQIAPGS